MVSLAPSGLVRESLTLGHISIQPHERCPNVLHIVCSRVLSQKSVISCGDDTDIEALRDCVEVLNGARAMRVRESGQAEVSLQPHVRVRQP